MKYKLLKDIITPMYTVKAGTISEEISPYGDLNCPDLWFESIEDGEVMFGKVPVTEKKDWFSEVIPDDLWITGSIHVQKCALCNRETEFSWICEYCAAGSL